MLQLKSFKFSQGEEASEFLKTHMLHGKSNILVSHGTGEFMIPYEDGTPKTKAHKIASLFEDMGTMEDKMAIIIHSQRVMEVELVGINKQIEELEAGKQEGVTKIIREENAKIDKEIKRLQNVKDQKEHQAVLNQAEITNMLTNIAVYKETINKLQNEAGE